MPPKRKATATKRKTKKEESSSEEEIDDVEEDSGEEEVVPQSKRSRSSSRVSKQEETKKEESAGADKLKLTWEDYDDTLYILSSEDLKPSDKIVSFDMDGTIVVPKSGKKFPNGRKDWKWLFPEIPEKLKEWNKKGYKMVVFTNQAGIEKGNQNPEDLKGKLVDLSVELGFPIQAFISAANDAYRKPNTNMWDIFVEKYNGGTKIDMEKSKYVGDAAGRADAWKKGAKKDHSATDRSFAFNVGISFVTPEEFFLDEKPAEFEYDCIDPAQVLKELESAKAQDIAKADGQELVIMVGRPASGKSSFAKKNFVEKQGYVHVNGDTLGTKAKCIKALEAALKEGKSAVVDNTCPSKKARKEFTSVADKHKVPYRCFYFDTPEKLAIHLNFLRVRMTNGEVRRIPMVAYRSFNKNFEEPSTKEGFSSVEKMSWHPDFKDDNAKKLFLQRTEGKC